MSLVGAHDRSVLVDGLAKAIACGHADDDDPQADPCEIKRGVRNAAAVRRVRPTSAAIGARLGGVRITLLCDRQAGVLPDGTMTPVALSY